MRAKQKAMQEQLAALVANYGYEPIRRGVEKMRPPKKAAAPKPVASPAKRRARTYARKNAVAVVNSLDIGEEHKQMLMVLAEKYDAKTFMPHVGSVRGFLEREGADISRIKSRQQVTVAVFKRLAEWDIERLREMDDRGWYAAHRGLEPIARAIENFGCQRRDALAGKRLP